MSTLDEQAREAVEGCWRTAHLVKRSVTEQLAFAASAPWKAAVIELLEALDDTEAAMGDISVRAAGVRRRIREQLG